MPSRSKHYLPKEIKERAAMMRLSGSDALREMKDRFISHLKRNGGAYYEACESFANEIGWKQSQRSDYSRRIRGWMAKDKVFLAKVDTICSMANDELFNTAVSTHMRRVATGDREIMVQNGKPVLSPRGMALKAKMEADEIPEYQILAALAEAHDEGQDVYVIRVSYPEQLTRQVLANYQPEVFAEKVDPRRLSDEALMRTLAAAMAMQNRETSVLAEFTEEEPLELPEPEEDGTD